MRYFLIALPVTLLLSACGTDHLIPVFDDSGPDVIIYTDQIMTAAADEMESGVCPVLSEVMMPDYTVMRDQAAVE